MYSLGPQRVGAIKGTFTEQVCTYVNTEYSVYFSSVGETMLQVIVTATVNSV